MLCKTYTSLSYLACLLIQSDGFLDEIDCWYTWQSKPIPMLVDSPAIHGDNKLTLVMLFVPCFITATSALVGGNPPNITASSSFGISHFWGRWYVDYSRERSMRM